MPEQARYPLKEFAYVNSFKCTADKCEDQCCSVWRVSINNEIIEKYKKDAPELHAKVTKDDSGPKFPLVDGSRACVNLDAKKLCTVHTKYGSDFLPNTCYFFPRNMRHIGENILVSATTSCPEIARLVLFSDDPFRIVDGDESRLPENVYNVKPEGVSEEDFLAVVQRFLAEATREDMDVELVMMRILIVSKMLDDYDITTWPKVINHLFELADFQYVAPPAQSFNQLDILLYISQLKDPGVARFDAAYNDAQKIFQINIDRKLNQVKNDISPAVKDAYYGSANAVISHCLKRFIASDLARTLFPYAWCDSDNAFEKAAIIAINFAMARLCLMGKIDENGNPPTEDEVVRSIQGIFRSQNHLTRNKVDFYKEKGLLNLGMLSQVIFIQ